MSFGVGSKMGDMPTLLMLWANIVAEPALLIDEMW